VESSVTASVVSSDGQRIRVASGSNVAEALHNANIEPDPNTWVWLNSSPEQYSDEILNSLLEVAERSPSLGVIGPKQVSTRNPRVITQLGLTLTPLGDAFSPVSNQLDQSQHDALSDVLAVGAEGMFIRTDVLAIAGGWSDSSPVLAADLDFCIRARMAGFRVAVAPGAKISSDGQASALGKRLKIEQRKAAIALRLRFAPLWLAIAYALALLPLSVLRVFYRLAQKRPDRILSELYGGVWAVATIGARFASRAVRPMLVVTRLRAMKGLRASWEQVRSESRSRAEQDEQAHNLAAFERGEFEEVANAKTFTASFGWLWMLLLLALSWQYFPGNAAPTGGAILPLSNSLGDLLARAGASWQPIGTGVFAPSDPFNWVLLALGSATFWMPQLAIGILLFAARALAFAAAWRVIGLLTQKAWVRSALAFAYAFWPSLTSALNEARLPAVVVSIVLPLLVLSVARAAGIGRRGSARSDRQTWSWVAASGLTYAVVGVSAPSLIPLTLLVLAIAAFGKIRRFLYLLWIPLPLAALFVPYAMHFVVTLNQPLSLLADPGVPAQTDAVPLLFASGLAVLALAAVVTRRWIAALSFWFIAALLIVAAWAFHETSFGGISGNPEPFVSALGLVIVLLAALALEQVKLIWLTRLAAAFVALAGIAPLSYQALISSPAWVASDGRVVPWLLEVEARTDATLLVLQPSDKGFSMQWLAARGLHLEDQSTAYRLSVATQVEANPEYTEVSAAVANLASANGQDVSETLDKYRIGYLLLPSSESAKAAELATAFDASPVLESAGVTSFGHLWRLVGFESGEAEKHSVWSVTKAVQLSVLLGFVLLAIPARKAGKAKVDSEIFVGESEDNS